MSDKELVLKCRGGDKSAWEELYAKYKPRVLALARKFFFVGGETEDLVQEGMFGLLSAVNGYNEYDGEFSVYANKCILNRIYDAIKKTVNNKSLALNRSISVEAADKLIDGISLEEEIIMRVDKSEYLQGISKILSPYEFQVFVMYCEGVTISEICSSLNKDYKSVDNSLNRAKRKILKNLEK